MYSRNNRPFSISLLIVRAAHLPTQRSHVASVGSTEKFFRRNCVLFDVVWQHFRKVLMHTFSKLLMFQNKNGTSRFHRKCTACFACGSAYVILGKSFFVTLNLNKTSLRTSEISLREQQILTMLPEVCEKGKKNLSLFAKF